MRVIYLIPLVVVFGLVALFWAGLHHDPHRVPSPLIGKPAPEFSLPTLKDPSATLTKQQLKGRVTLVNVWASWCVSCRAETQVLDALASRDMVPIIGLDYKDRRADALRWLQNFGDPYTVSAYDVTGDVGINWGVYGVPETYVVDKKGYIRLKYIGPLTPQAVHDKVLPLVRKLQAEKP